MKVYVKMKPASSRLLQMQSIDRGHRQPQFRDATQGQLVPPAAAAAAAASCIPPHMRTASPSLTTVVDVLSPAFFAINHVLSLTFTFDRPHPTTLHFKQPPCCHLRGGSWLRAPRVCSSQRRASPPQGATQSRAVFKIGTARGRKKRSVLSVRTLSLSLSLLPDRNSEAAEERIE